MPRVLQALASLVEDALVTGRAAEQAAVAEDAPPLSACSAGINVLKDLAASLHARFPVASRLLADVWHKALADKSPSERLFLLAVLVIFLLFVVIVPAYEALLSSIDEEEALFSAVPAPPPPRRRRPDRPVPRVIYASTDALRTPPSRAASSGSSCGSGSMETIEESEEEDAEVEGKQVRIASENGPWPGTPRPQ